ncbi:cobyrinic acid a,c-diamide synthase [Sinobacterium caligoides]|uniref:Cobyrinic acid a,c-diamide synthase n=1 Tax=Sinobacterium caligoides TaxID=933926 RepID=A0A3N2DYE8_9GAMM|nr:cobyrinate a,c-diamide synthase [Sinobacterium caligoides]ROS04896.1 cobyrinic acid a,c-diamide synthase [Sinobacterium caligoides]
MSQLTGAHQIQSCPALFLAAPASGQGKTTVTAGLARYFTRQGLLVRVFKTGPDYLDPQILAQASRQPVEQLDLWMAGEAYCRQKLFEAAEVADLILVEGAMGMFDGEPSSADLAACFGIPIAIVMDVKGMAQTAAAVATGLASFRDDCVIAGLIANNCGSERHAQLIRDALPETLPLLATLKRDPSIALPERHLGLVQAEEVADELEQRFEAAADWLTSSLQASGDTQSLLQLPRPVDFVSAPLASVPPLLAGQHIAIARDEAFSFIYEANLRVLAALGATYSFFSPLRDSVLPVADALWLPGGYPELHADKLQANNDLTAQIQAFYHESKPILAECGGLLYCLETLIDLEQNQFNMLGLLSGVGAMRGRSGCQGMQSAVLPEGEVRAHAHHRSRSENTPAPMSYGRRQRHPAPGEAVYRSKGLTASYLHLFFASNPQAIAALFSSKITITNDSAIARNGVINVND